MNVLAVSSHGGRDKQLSWDYFTGTLISFMKDPLITSAFPTGPYSEYNH